MPPSKKKSGAPPPAAGYSDAAKTAVQETTLRVKEMHGAIADKSFDILQKIPLVSGPASFVQSAHDTIAAGVYAAIHHGTGGLLGAAALLEKHSTGYTRGEPPGRLASGLRSALNGAFGDHLAASNNLLAISMAIHVDGAPVSLDAASLHAAFPNAGKRLCVFIHGLSCDEHCWEADKTATKPEVNFGRQLHSEFGYTPLYLRYNTGLPIADNGAQLAVLLDELLDAWPQPDSELLIIGHSMGGLIALGACEQSANEGMAWPQAMRMLICLGSPHLGSPVERLGHLATSMLHLSKTTAPSARSPLRAVRASRIYATAPVQRKNLPHTITSPSAFSAAVWPKTSTTRLASFLVTGWSLWAAQQRTKSRATCRAQSSATSDIWHWPGMCASIGKSGTGLPRWKFRWQKTADLRAGAQASTPSSKAFSLSKR